MENTRITLEYSRVPIIDYNKQCKGCVFAEVCNVISFEAFRFLCEIFPCDKEGYHWVKVEQ